MKFIFPCVIETKSIHTNNFNYCTNDYLQTELPALFSFICGIIRLHIEAPKEKFFLCPENIFQMIQIFLYISSYKDSCVISTAY